jgi:hypothetical protein
MIPIAHSFLESVIQGPGIAKNKEKGGDDGTSGLFGRGTCPSRSVHDGRRWRGFREGARDAVASSAGSRRLPCSQLPRPLEYFAAYVYHL